MNVPLSPHVVLYVTPWCPYCHRAVALLKRKKVEFLAIDVSNQPATRVWLQDVTGRHTVPQIFIGQNPIGGSDELHALERAGRLNALLIAGQG